MKPQSLITSYSLNTASLNQRLDGLTHEDNLRQFSFGDDCLNWLAGRLAASGPNMLAMLGAEPLWRSGEVRQFLPGLPLVTGAEVSAPFDVLLITLHQMRQRIVPALRGMFGGEPDKIIQHKTLVNTWRIVRLIRLIITGRSNIVADLLERI